MTREQQIEFMRHAKQRAAQSAEKVHAHPKAQEVLEKGKRDLKRYQGDKPHDRKVYA